MDIELVKNCSLKDYSYFKIGGNVENLYFPKNEEEFVYLLKTLKNPLVFGGFSNVLFGTEGVEADLICTTKMNKYEIESTHVKALCGVRGAVLSRVCMENSLTGFEFMSGFPGTIGGNIFMNASAHSQAISDNLISAKVFDLGKKTVIELSKEELNFAYRTSILQSKPYVLISAGFELLKSDKQKIEAQIVANREFRKAHQPQNLPNVGSIFRNPEGNSAGKLLDEIGAKAFIVGGAKVFENHANFIINVDNATSTDVLELMFKMYNCVKNKFDIELKPEVKFIGKKNQREDEICKILFQK